MQEFGYYWVVHFRPLLPCTLPAVNDWYIIARKVTTMAWEATQALIRAKTNPVEPAYDLTERELDVLMGMAEGLTNRQIAEELDISRFTVNAHVSNILTKLAVGSRTEAVSIALQHNLINPNS